MKLCVDFDDALIQRYVRRGSNPLFTIYWKHGSEAYPEEEWLDFGSVILGWWLVAAKSLLSNSTEADLPFMDGPFRLQARRDGNMLTISANSQSVQWQISIESFVSELLKTASEVVQKFDELNITDTEGLKAGIRALKIAASETTRLRRSGKTLVQHF